MLKREVPCHLWSGVFKCDTCDECKLVYTDKAKYVGLEILSYAKLEKKDNVSLWERCYIYLQCLFANSVDFIFLAGISSLFRCRNTWFKLFMVSVVWQDEFQLVQISRCRKYMEHLVISWRLRVPNRRNNCKYFWFLVLFHVFGE